MKRERIAEIAELLDNVGSSCHKIIQLFHIFLFCAAVYKIVVLLCGRGEIDNRHSRTSFFSVYEKTMER